MSGIEAIKFTFLSILNSAVILSCQYVLYACYMHYKSIKHAKSDCYKSELTDATTAHTSIFRVNTVSSVSIVSAVGKHWLSANTGKIVQIDGASPLTKPSSENGSAVCG